MTQASDRAFNALSKAFKDDKNVRLSKGPSFKLTGSVRHGYPSGVAQLDLALEKNGLPGGRLIELYGMPYCGKTTLATQILAQVQKQGGQIMWVDTEKSLDVDRMEELGVDTKETWFGDADTLEGIFRSIEAAMEAFGQASDARPFAIAVDSISAVTSAWELEHALDGEPRVGHDAKLIKLGVKRLNPKVAAQGGLVIFINHAYESMKMFGGTVSSGGQGVKYLSSLRIELAHIKELTSGGKDTKRRLGQEIEIRVRKARGTSLSNMKFRMPLYIDGGFDVAGSLLEAAAETGMIKKVTAEKYQIGDELVFTKSDWSSILNTQLGGFDPVYQAFHEHAISVNKIKKWGAAVSEDDEVSIPEEVN